MLAGELLPVMPLGPRRDESLGCADPPGVSKQVWQDSAQCLGLCCSLGVTDNGPSVGDPQFRLMTCSRRQFGHIDAMAAELNRREIIVPGHVITVQASGDGC